MWSCDHCDESQLQLYSLFLLFCDRHFWPISLQISHVQTQFVHRSQWITKSLQVLMALAAIRQWILTRNESVEFLWHLPLTKVMRKTLTGHDAVHQACCHADVAHVPIITSQKLDCGCYAATMVAWLLRSCVLEQKGCHEVDAPRSSPRRSILMSGYTTVSSTFLQTPSQHGRTF